MTLFSALLSTCSETEQAADPTSLAAEDSGLSTSEVALVSSNPFFSKSQLYLNYPPFDQIENAHFLPAFLRGMAEQSAEIEAIARQGEPATFVNTIIAMELSGQLLNRTDSVFSAMSSAHTNDEIRALEQQLAPQLAAHDDSIMLNRDLFARISRLYEQREALALDAQSKRLLGEYYSDFVRAGAALSVDQQQRMKELNGQIATLQTRYSQQILSEMNELAILVDSREELTGLDEALVAAAEAEADERGLQGKFLIPLLNTSGQPALASLQNRAVRETMHRTSLSRGNRGGEFDNRELLVDILRLRAERAQLLGFENHAHYILEDRTAQTVAAVNERLAELAPPAVANARREAADLQKMIYDEGADFELAAWDWDFYTEKVRAARYEFDASQLRPYFELNNVLQRGVFFAAEKLYGISFKERTDLPLYQEDVRVFEVFDAVGTTLALFIADYYARPSKRGGAWNTSYILQSNLMNTQAIMANHLNITEPIGNEATLLSFDEVNTLFHEFGHALHVMFSNVEYPYFSGTRVPRDFVEYPSQVNEMWATWPEVLANYAIHYQTGQPMPDELLDKVLSSQKFNQGFATTEYLSASILDQALHQLAPDKVPDADQLMQFESEVLETAGVAMPEIPPRYRSTYFNHIMGGYSAGYYSYIWSEVLDADSVEWFKENGGLRRQNGDHFRRTLLSRGASEDAMVLFRNFRGRDADIAPLLERRGLN
ncbi:MAG: dipeptidyl carboxypeptidase II [Gammaproteobacteria bacterium]|nr:dipeptidyl carboxypeptidase II [Gammaproteobacteria bacterium]|tara:strand:+ start:15349 stop:17502 length:2154 start_codon:yes stop_codon:yes gene_type:complete